MHRFRACLKIEIYSQDTDELRCQDLDPPQADTLRGPQDILLSLVPDPDNEVRRAPNGVYDAFGVAPLLHY